MKKQILIAFLAMLPIAVQAACNAPDTRFEEHSGRNVISDKNTGLMWSKCVIRKNNHLDCSGGLNTSNSSSGDRFKWNQLAANVSSKNSHYFLGYNDWRVPNVKELASLLEFNCGNQPAINRSVFADSIKGNFWSSTHIASTGSSSYDNKAWAVGFDNGGVYVDDATSGIYYRKYLRLVRDDNGAEFKPLVKPSHIIINDVANTLSWTNASGYADATKYEYSLDGGTSWTQATANPQPLADTAVAKEQIKLRLKAQAGQYTAGDAIVSDYELTANSSTKLAMRYLDNNGNDTSFSNAQCIQFVNTPASGNQQILATVLANGAAGSKGAYTEIFATSTYGNQALNKDAKARTLENATNIASNAVDNSFTSRWASRGGNLIPRGSEEERNTWIMVDLGAVYTINKVDLVWETARAIDYDIEVSTEQAAWDQATANSNADHSSWTQAASVVGNSSYNSSSNANNSYYRKTKSTSFNTVSARFVKIKGKKRAEHWNYGRLGYSIWDLKIYGKATLCGLDKSSFKAPTENGLNFLFSSKPSVLLQHKTDAGYWYSNNNGTTGLAKDTSQTNTSSGDNYRRYISINPRYKADWQSLMASSDFDALNWASPALPAPLAPTSSEAQQSNAQDTFAWNVVNGYTELAHYQYSTDNGATWADVTASNASKSGSSIILNVGNSAIAVGHLQVRVKAVANQNSAGVVLKNTLEYTTVFTPPAPTSPVSDDAANTFGWTNVSSGGVNFDAAKDYEYSIDGGTSWKSAASQPIKIGNLSLAIGKVQVRVKKVVNQNTTGTPLSSTQAFSMSVPTEATGKLNDTGVSKKDNATTACPADSQEDCHFGRDKFITAASQKLGAGASGFDFTKLDASGGELANSATTWECVRDNITGLIWQKQASATEVKNWTQATAVNSMNLCGLTGWRVPTRTELLGIVNFATGKPDTDFFADISNTEEYWTAHANAGNNAQGVIFRLGDYGVNTFANKTNNYKVLWVNDRK